MRRTLAVLLVAVAGLFVVPAAASAASPLNPVGSFDALSYNGTLTVGGWTFDPETAASIQVHAYVDGRIAAVRVADGPRYDVAAAYPSYGPNHGWSWDLGKFAAGAHQVCVYAINVGIGDTNPSLGCRSFTVAGNAALNPIGNVDQVALIPQGLYLAGWTFDPETAAPIDVHVYVDGQIARLATANTSRGDIAAVYPSYGAAHGFEMIVTPPLPGRHQVCIYAINVGQGTTNPALGCRSFTVDYFNFGATATYTNDLAVAVSLPQRVVVSKTASPSPNPQYTGLLFTVTVTNRSGETFDPVLFDMTLTSGPTGREDSLTFDSGGSNPSNRISGTIPPGAVRSGTYLFQVPNSELNDLQLEVNPYFFDYESVFFVGVG